MAVRVARFTDAPSTPSTAPSARSTLFTQDAQVIPSISRVMSREISRVPVSVVTADHFPANRATATMSSSTF